MLGVCHCHSGSPFYAGVVKSQCPSSYSSDEDSVKLTLDINFCTELRLLGALQNYPQTDFPVVDWIP